VSRYNIRNVDAAAFTLAHPGRELELILDPVKFRVVAILIPEKIPMKQIETAYAIGGGMLTESRELATRWTCWAVIADRMWAQDKVKTAALRPSGAKFFFAS
jgi:hypothetical protein